MTSVLNQSNFANETPSFNGLQIRGRDPERSRPLSLSAECEANDQLGADRRGQVIVVNCGTTGSTNWRKCRLARHVGVVRAPLPGGGSPAGRVKSEPAGAGGSNRLGGSGGQFPVPHAIQHSPRGRDAVMDDLATWAHRQLGAALQVCLTRSSLAD